MAYYVLCKNLRFLIFFKHYEYMANPLNFLQLLTLSCLIIISPLSYAFSYGDPSALEQAQLELINRARANPLKEAKRLGIDLFEGISTSQMSSNPAQPLSFNAQLLETSRAHSVDMLQQSYFEHKSSLGISPFVRMQQSNYDYAYAGENIAANGYEGVINDIQFAEDMHNSLFIDAGYPDRGHRIAILNPNMRELGAGLAYGAWKYDKGNFNAALLTVDFGSRKFAHPIILGVVYDDNDHNAFYTAGEGLGGIEVTIAAANQTTHTASAGGYGIEVEPLRDYTITFNHPQFGSVSKTVHVNNDNVKVDILLSEFALANRPKNIANQAPQQCAVIEQKKLSIPCINALGQVYAVELLDIGQKPSNQRFGIQNINFKDLSRATACGSYDATSGVANIGCILIDNQKYNAELVINPAAGNAVFDLKLHSVFMF